MVPGLRLRERYGRGYCCRVLLSTPSFAKVSESGRPVSSSPWLFSYSLDGRAGLRPHLAVRGSGVVAALLERFLDRLHALVRSLPRHVLSGPAVAARPAHPPIRVG